MPHRNLQLTPIPQLLQWVSLRAFNTFGLDVRARHYVQITEPGHLDWLNGNATFRTQPRFILGGGSNVIFADHYEGLVVHNCITGWRVAVIDPDSIFVEAGSGMNWHELVMIAVQKNWGGIENLALIPGTVGAAPIQNIGAYGAELASVLERVDAYDLRTGSIVTLSTADCQLGYRDSIFKREAAGRYVIVNVTLRLQRYPKPNTSYAALRDELGENTKPTVRDVAEAVIRIRRSKLPDPAVLGNCGSFFKNPVVGHQQFAHLQAQYPAIPHYHNPQGIKVPAAWLIEQCGYKGRRLGNVGVHDKQALVLVNHGGATGSEVAALAADIQAAVQARFHIALEREVNIV